MSHEASFAVLFRRSCHAGREPQAQAISESEAQTEKKREQKELFAVAAVAFTMKFDEGFKRQFLKTICGVNDVENLKDYKILIQDGDFADLLLFNEKKSEVIVIEFKIDAKLKDHQNFGKEYKKVFWESNGYGEQILRSKYRDYKVLKYIVLLKSQKRDELNLSEAIFLVNGIQCYSRVWRDLLCVKNEETQLVTDLFDCLSQALNIGELKSRNYMKKNMSKSVCDAVDIYNILESFTENFKFDKPKADKDGKNVFFGVNIQRNAKGFDLIKKYSPSSNNPFCWFGYEHLEDGEPSERKSIWVYGISEDYREEVEVLFKKHLGGKNQIQTSGDSLIIFPQNESETEGDVEWFQSIIDTLKHLRK